MAKTFKSGVTLLILTFFCSTFIFGNSAILKNVNAAAKINQSSSSTQIASVKYKIKDGTITIYGKGKMPNSMTFKKNRQIHTVIIRNGVTSVSKYAFYNCKNLQKIKLPNTLKVIDCYAFYGTKIKKIIVPNTVSTIGQCAFSSCDSLSKLSVPGNYNVKTLPGDDAYDSISGDTVIETVKFSSSLKLDVVSTVKTDNLVVYKKDPAYKSINGIIYSKNGLNIVRVPSERTELIIEDGCQEFNLQSILYAQTDSSSDAYACCTNLTKLVIPGSVTTIEKDKYFAKASISQTSVTDIAIGSDTLDSLSISTLYSSLARIDIYHLSLALGNKLRFENGMFITNDNVVIGYNGRLSTVEIPEGVTEIAPNAFNSYVTDSIYSFKKVILPSTLLKIGDDAFNGCIYLSEINFPDKLYYIGNRAFRLCNFKSITLPETVLTWGDYVFADNAIETINFPLNLKTIPNHMFSRNSISDLTLGDNIEIIGEGAFENNPLTNVSFGHGIKTIGNSSFAYTILKNITLPYSVTNIESFAFSNCSDFKNITINGNKLSISDTAFDGCNNLRICYSAGIKSAKTNAYISLLSQFKNKKKFSGTIHWNQVTGASGYQIRYATNKNFKKYKAMDVGRKNTSAKVVLNGRINTDSNNPSKQYLYVKIRPFKIVKGKRVYGKWCMCSL